MHRHTSEHLRPDTGPSTHPRPYSYPTPPRSSAVQLWWPDCSISDRPGAKIVASHSTKEGAALLTNHTLTFAKIREQFGPHTCAFVYYVNDSTCNLNLYQALCIATRRTKHFRINTLKFHCFTVHFESLSFIHTNSWTFSYNYVSVF